ncbi:MAG TPA: hypothetical protein VF885_09240 [Arthrobacter sp.]
MASFTLDWDPTIANRLSGSWRAMALAAGHPGVGAVEDEPRPAMIEPRRGPERLIPVARFTLPRGELRPMRIGVAGSTAPALGGRFQQRPGARAQERGAAAGTPKALVAIRARNREVGPGENEAPPLVLPRGHRRRAPGTRVMAGGTGRAIPGPVHILMTRGAVALADHEADAGLSIGGGPRQRRQVATGQAVAGGTGHRGVTALER